MAAYQRTRVLSTLFMCNKRVCNAELVTYPSGDAVADNTFSAGEEARAAAAALGWSGWRGTRETYTYCPEHGPGGGSGTMRKLW